MPVLRWSLTTVRRIEALRDRIHHQCGTRQEPVFADDFPDDHLRVTMQWRWPLRPDEIAQMALTPEALERKGRP